MARRKRPSPGPLVGVDGVLFGHFPEEVAKRFRQLMRDGDAQTAHILATQMHAFTRQFRNPRLPINWRARIAVAAAARMAGASPGPGPSGGQPFPEVSRTHAQAALAAEHGEEGRGQGLMPGSRP
jgi:hypothetical protein